MKFQMSDAMTYRDGKVARMLDEQKLAGFD